MSRCLSDHYFRAKIPLLPHYNKSEVSLCYHSCPGFHDISHCTPKYTQQNMKKYFESACDSESVPPYGPDLLDEALLTLFELN